MQSTIDSVSFLLNTTCRHTVKHLYPLIRSATISHILILLIVGTTQIYVLGQEPQAEPAPVPKAIAIARPSTEEVQLAERSLKKFLATADTAVQELNQKYPGLFSVRAPRENSATIPNLLPFFQMKHQANLKVARQGDIDALFMGDSITDFWRNPEGPYAGKPVFEKYFGSIEVANFGIAGDTTQGVLFRLQNGEGQGFSPKVVMLMIGANNIGRNTAAEIAEGIGAVVLELQRDFPQTKILLLGIFPRSRANDPVRATIAEINKIISKLHDGNRVHYLDIGSKFLDAEGNIPKDVMSDGLHPSTKGYEIWAKAVKDPLADLMKSSAAEVPLVYNVENTGADSKAPPLPAFADLPSIEPLTDPFAWSDGSGRSTDFGDWRRRRAEIKAEIEHYEIGPKPGRSQDITASYSEGTLTVNVTVNGNTLTLTSKVTLPSGDGPFPTVIGIGWGTGSLPPSIFRDRKIAQIAFNFGQVMNHTQTRGREPINKLYPDLVHMGAYSAWPWGVSRIIDGLELVSDDLPIDRKHLAVTGCSFAGKMALFAGAFDERIALTIAQEPGGGGAAAWRVSETLGNVETLGRTSRAWFMEDMFQFADSVSKLPYDHHELMAMVAPRALLVLGNPDYEWLAEESGYVSCRAAHEVWKAFGVPDRFGFSIVAGHGHCQLPKSQYPEVEAFVGKFLLGDMKADTNVMKSPYDYVDYSRWFHWWGTGNPVLPEREVGDQQTVYFEAESPTNGKNWEIIEDDGASGGNYVAVKPDIESVGAAPGSSDDHISIAFTADKDTTYHLFARLNCPTADDDSFWIRMDDGSFAMANNLVTRGWKWMRISRYVLKAGEHTLTIAYRENGAGLDKICVSTYPYAPEGMGGEAESD